MSNFTPAPWNIHYAYPLDAPVRTVTSEPPFDYWNGIIAKGETILAETKMQTVAAGWPHVTDVEEARANAWLMCSAPELHAAALEAAKLLASYDFLDEKAAAVLAMLDDALAKSEGRVIA